MSSAARAESNVNILTETFVDILELIDIWGHKFAGPIRLHIFREDHGGLDGACSPVSNHIPIVGKAATVGVKEEDPVSGTGVPPSTVPPIPPSAVKESTTGVEADARNRKENIDLGQADISPDPMDPAGFKTPSPRRYRGKRKRRTTLQMLGLESDDDATEARDGTTCAASGHLAPSRDAKRTCLAPQGDVKEEGI
ncbi:hypothetical protein OF83DRAFT_1088759 [Amylostereum chailletii]|nr:hypothetical protein OF83DRAFT_1088759 [Amylostereum chailletii]